MFLLIFTQTILYAFRKGGGAFGAAAFYLIAATLFAFALGPDALKTQAGAAMALSMLLALVTALPLFYERDYEDGTLEQLLLQPVALEWLALAKMGGQWIAIIIPMLLLSPLLAVIADLPPERLPCLLGNLALASVSLVAISSLAAAITIGNRRGGLLQALIMLPLCIPVLIFASAGNAPWLLAALALMFVPMSCWISAGLIRLGEE